MMDFKNEMLEAKDLDRILEYLKEQDCEISITEISKDLNLNYDQTFTSCKKLGAYHYVNVRDVSSNDGRELMIEIIEEGRAFLADGGFSAETKEEEEIDRQYKELVRKEEARELKEIAGKKRDRLFKWASGIITVAIALCAVYLQYKSNQIQEKVVSQDKAIDELKKAIIDLESKIEYQSLPDSTK